MGTTYVYDVLYSTGNVPFVSLLELSACIRVGCARGEWPSATRQENVQNCLTRIF